MAVVTILAFVYVPLNLATSIFGMNIYQLNRSGQDLSTFLATAFVALFVTVGAWYLIEQANSYRRWRETRLKNHHHKPSKYTLMMRINMLVWFSLSPYKYWMIKSGLWWRLLTNNSSRLGRKIEPYNFGRQQRWTAAEFLSQSGLLEPEHDDWNRNYNDWIWKYDNPREPPAKKSSSPAEPAPHG